MPSASACLMQTVVDRHDGDARLEQSLRIHKAVQSLLFAALPAAAVDDEHQRCGRCRLGLPEVEDVPLMGPVRAPPDNVGDGTDES